MFDEKQEEILNEFAQNLSSKGITVDQYLKMIGTSRAAFRDNARPAAIARTKVELLLKKVAELEGIEISDDEYNEECARISGTYGVELSYVQESVGKERIVDDLKQKKAAEIIKNSGVKTAPPEPESAETAE
jgi:trigger factor